MIFEMFAWLLLPLVPALVALYFLKLRRQEKVISSTFLWVRSLEDLHVNAPFQRIRRSLLLLLQLLILTLVILSASKPMVSGTSLSGVTRIVLIDHSASMNTKEEGGSRLRLAKERALELVDSLSANDLMAVVAFADRPSVVQPLTSDRARLKDAIGSIEATSLPTSFLPALRTVSSISEAAASTEIFVLSDGCFEPLTSVAAELERLNLKFLSVGSRNEDQGNLGIVELDVRFRLGRDRGTELFVSIFNSGAEARTATVSLYQGDLLRDAAEVEVAPGQTAAQVFDASAYSGGVVFVELDDGGALADDDQAWVRIDPPRPVEVLLVGEKNFFLENVLKVDPFIRARRVTLDTFVSLQQEGHFAADPAEVLVFDRDCPKQPTDRPALYLGCLPDLKALGLDAPAGSSDPIQSGNQSPVYLDDPSLIDWDRSHPANRFLAFADLWIAKSLRLPEGNRFRSIMDAAEGSLAGVVTLTPAGKPPVSLLLLGFDVRNSNWPWLRSFPIFFTNALSWLGATAGYDNAQRYRTGETLVYGLRNEKIDNLRFVDPSDRELTDLAQGSGEVLFSATDQRGIYELFDEGKLLQRYPVSLLDKAESSISAAEEIRVGANRAANPEELQLKRDLWKWAALLALAFILLEWWVYNRKMTI